MAEDFFRAFQSDFDHYDKPLIYYQDIREPSDAYDSRYLRYSCVKDVEPYYIGIDSKGVGDKAGLTYKEAIDTLRRKRLYVDEFHFLRRLESLGVIRKTEAADSKSISFELLCKPKDERFLRYCAWFVGFDGVSRRNLSEFLKSSDKECALGVAIYILSPLKHYPRGISKRKFKSLTVRAIITSADGTEEYFDYPLSECYEVLPCDWIAYI